MDRHPRPSRLLALLALAAILSGCKQVPMLPGISTHRIDIQQGNVVTQEMVSKLKPGMSRQQVRFVMGTPPIVDPFHKDRWDYVYYLNKAGKVVEYRRLILLFEGDLLKRVEGDVIAGAPDSGGAKPEPRAAGARPPENAAEAQPGAGGGRPATP